MAGISKLSKFGYSDKEIDHPSKQGQNFGSL